MDTVGYGHSRTRTQYDMDTVGYGHCRTWTQ